VSDTLIATTKTLEPGRRDGHGLRWPAPGKGRLSPGAHPVTAAGRRSRHNPPSVRCDKPGQPLPANAEPGDMRAMRWSGHE
jgi:hypothetical protein